MSLQQQQPAFKTLFSSSRDNVGTTQFLISVVPSASNRLIGEVVQSQRRPLLAATTAFTFKTLLRHYAKRVLIPRSLNVKLGPRLKGHKGRAVWLA